MSDLVERLRLRSGPFQDGLWKQAADRIEELETEAMTWIEHSAKQADRIESLEKALREIYDMDAPKRGFPPDIERVEGPFARIARAALNGDKP